MLHNVSAEKPLEAYVSFERDTSHARQLILDFVESYNEMIRSIRELTEVKRPRQTGGGLYLPLTEDQRKEMSDREIELWEEKARAGILSRDDTLRTLLSDLHRNIFQDVRLSGGGTLSLLNMGIRTSSDLARFGELQMDEERLDFFLENRMDDVSELFTNVSEIPATGDDADRAGRLRESGLGQRIHDIIHWQLSFGGGLHTRVGATSGGGAALDTNEFNNRISQEDRRIDDMIKSLQRRENRYYEKFGRLESAMVQANSQMMFLEQMIWGA
jgi:flagellar hook-associated protein 2